MKIAGKQACESQGVYCDLAAIPATERVRYQELVAKVFGAVCAREELPDGYAYRFAEGGVDLVAVAEWIEMERRCCPFLQFSLEVGEGCRLTLRGPEGVKTILATALGGHTYEWV